MSKQFRRGFKAQSDKLVRKFREELCLKYHDPLCPWKLANHLEIPIQALSTFRDKIPDAVTHCMEREQESFSAITLCLGDLKLIIHNDSHSLVRQAANSLTLFSNIHRWRSLMKITAATSIKNRKMKQIGLHSHF
jgi:hypothetical protein